MTQVEAAANAPAEGAKADRGHLVQLIVAAVLMGATGVRLVVTGVWAFTFEGSMSRELTATLNGHSLMSAGVLVLVLGLVLLVCVVGVLIGPGVNRWAGLVARLAGIVAAAVAALSGIWLVRYYPGWVVAYAVLGGLVVFALASYEPDLHAGWPWASLRPHVANVFAMNTTGLNVQASAAAPQLAKTPAGKYPSTLSPTWSSPTANDGRLGVQRARRAAEWAKQKYAGSSAEYFWRRLDLVQGLSFATALRKLWRAS